MTRDNLEPKPPEIIQNIRWFILYGKKYKWYVLVFLLVVFTPFLYELLITNSTQDKPPDVSISNVTIGEISDGVVHTGKGNIYIINVDSLSEESIQRLAKELNVTRAALENFFEILKQNQVSPVDLDDTLRKIAKQYNELREELRIYKTEDIEITEMKHQAAAALDVGDFDRAENLLNKASLKDINAAKEMQNVAALHLLSAAMSKAAIGDLKYSELAFDEAALYYSQAVELVTKESEEIVAVYLNKWGIALLDAGKYDEAKPLFHRALAISRRTFGAEHPLTAVMSNSLATIYYKQGEYDAAEPLYRQALAINEKNLGADHRNTAVALINLANILMNKGDYDGAEALLYRRGLNICEKLLGPEHPDTATCLNNLAVLHKRKEDYETSEKLFRQALAIRENVLGPEHLLTSLTLDNLAQVLLATGNSKEAEQLSRRALAIAQNALGPEHPDLANYLNTQAVILKRKKEYKEAERVYRQALAISENALGVEHPNTVAIRKNIDEMFKSMDQAKKNNPLY